MTTAPRSSREGAALAERIAAEREVARARVAALARDFDEIVEASADSVADDEHDPEGATIAFERAQVAALLAAARHAVAELDEAERRRLRGEYGVCERCGERIAAERLMARPAARHCVRCSSRLRDAPGAHSQRPQGQDPVLP